MATKMSTRLRTGSRIAICGFAGMILAITLSFVDADVSRIALYLGGAVALAGALMMSVGAVAWYHRARAIEDKRGRL